MAAFFVGLAVIAVIGGFVYWVRRREWPDRMARVMAESTVWALKNPTVNTELIANVPGLDSRITVTDVRLELAELIQLGNEIAIAAHFTGEPAKALDLIHRARQQLQSALRREGIVTDANAAEAARLHGMRRDQYGEAAKSTGQARDRFEALRPIAEIACREILGENYQEGSAVLPAWIGMLCYHQIEVMKATLAGNPQSAYSEFALPGSA
jgi:hypothetical protein